MPRTSAHTQRIEDLRRELESIHEYHNQSNAVITKAKHTIDVYTAQLESSYLKREKDIKKVKDELDKKVAKIDKEIEELQKKKVALQDDADQKVVEITNNTKAEDWLKSQIEKFETKIKQEYSNENRIKTRREIHLEKTIAHLENEKSKQKKKAISQTEVWVCKKCNDPVDSYEPYPQQRCSQCRIKTWTCVNKVYNEMYCKGEINTYEQPASGMCKDCSQENWECTKCDQWVCGYERPTNGICEDCCSESSMSSFTAPSDSKNILVQTNRSSPAASITFCNSDSDCDSDSDSEPDDDPIAKMEREIAELRANYRKESEQTEQAEQQRKKDQKDRLEAERKRLMDLEATEPSFIVRKELEWKRRNLRLEDF